MSPFSDADFKLLKERISKAPKPTSLAVLAYTIPEWEALLARLEAAEYALEAASEHRGICPETELRLIKWRKAAGK